MHPSVWFSVSGVCRSFAVAVALWVVGVIRPGLGAWLAAENGPVEAGAVALWVITGLVVLWAHKPRPSTALALAVVCFGLALREHGLPPEVIPSGKALVSLSHYADAHVALGRRVAEALAVSGFLLSVAVTIRHGWVALVRRAGWREPSGRLLGLGLVSLALAQGFEALAGPQGVLPEELLECVGAWLVLGAALRWAVPVPRPAMPPADAVTSGRAV